MKRVFIGIAGLLIVIAAALVTALRASLPDLDGAISLNGLSAPVLVQRDRIGVTTLRGRSRLDVARATGFVHAQDRFFQMDLLRRVAAGELAALFGAAAVDHDRRKRIHGLRKVARAALGALTPRERALLDAYVDGVNAGLDQLSVAPPEYLLLRSTPDPWRPEDTLLVVEAMFLRLSDGNAMTEMRMGLLYECLPEAVAAFLASPDPEWAAPVDGGALTAAPIPDASVYDLRKLEDVDFNSGRSLAQTLALDPDLPAGASNAWVVSGARSASGRALVANDMHLKLGLPTIWYRMRLVVADGTEQELDVSGVTLPGAPVVVAGSNGNVAWGFTNSYGDWSDRIRVRVDPKDAGRYLTPDGPRRFRVREERIRVRGAEDLLLPVRETIWGPVVPGPRQRPTAIRWLGHRPEAINLRLLDFERATSVVDILAIAPWIGIPPQNLNAGDSGGHIGWTIAGRIPRRKDYDSRRPTDGAATVQGWDGWLRAQEYPRILDPPGGLIWTANHQVVTGKALARIGDSGYWHGARARQIRDSLRALDRATEQDMLDIQLDVRMLFLGRWKTLLLALLDRPRLSAHRRAGEFRAALLNGNDQASVDSVDYRLVWTFRMRLRDVVFSAITAPCRKLVPGYRFEGFRQYEGPLWRLISERPAHLLHPDYANWNALLESVAGETIDYFATEFEGPFIERIWGEHNIVYMRHPLTRALPVLSQLLNIEPLPMPGDRNMPMVMSYQDGASERFAVAPGREASGYLHMPGGQSGHFLSPYYRLGHQAWVRGQPTPFLPGETAHALRLLPAAGDG